jgi:aminopeptidase N
MIYRICLLALGLQFLSCGMFLSSTPENMHVLSEKDAQIRAEQVKNVRYEISLSISPDKEFQGKVNIYFDMNKIDSPLRVDFFKGQIQSLTINQNKIKNIDYNEGYFMVSSNSLVVGKNQIEIEYSHPFSRTGNGLHSFKDPEDNETYIYSQFETNHANAMFPSFDQPDIKASYKMDVTHPANWKVISSTLPNLIEKNGTLTKTYFPETKRFSTYVFSLIAGPYAEWKDTTGSIPLRLFARKSMAKYVDSKLWFTVTKQGFSFFEKYFDIRYPFGKYDQIVVPEFNFGAMENVGAVTFSERNLSRGQTTRRAQEKLASVILHEMAHMWFGNLVTMKWWDGLWLNESFATYLAAKAQYESTEFKEAWESFFTGMKVWAYNSDRMVTTHSIQGKVKDTEEAFINFDGITYGKGAAVLRQLQYFVGKENFRLGVSNYLKKYSYSNAELGDFLHSIETTSNKDLKKWSSDWLETEGFNRVSYEKTCNSSKNQLETITIIQDSSTNTKIPRDHRMEIALFQTDNGRATMYHSLPVEYSNHKTEINLKNKNIKCPDFIFLNYKDYDFVRVDISKDILEEKNLQTITSILSSNKETLISLMLWRDLFEEVRDGDLGLERYRRFAMEYLPTEKVDIVLESNLGNITSNRFISYHAMLHLKKPSERAPMLKELEEYTWNHFNSSAPHSDRKRFWFLNYLSVAQSKDFFDNGRRILTGKESIPGFKIDQDIRWSILKRMCSFNYDDTVLHSLLEAERSRDRSKIGLDSAYACEAAHPDPVTKGKWMAILTNPSEEYSASTLRSVLHYIFPLHQKMLQIPYVEFYYHNIHDGKIGGDENYQEYYSDLLAPRFCTEENRHILRSFINTNKKIPMNIQKNLKEVLESEEECIRVRHSNKGF